MFRPFVLSAAAALLLASTAIAEDQTHDLTSWLQDRQVAMTDTLNRDLLSGGTSEKANVTAPAPIIDGMISVIPVTTERTVQALRPAIKTNKI